jgi:hypothetical protein
MRPIQGRTKIDFGFYKIGCLQHPGIVVYFLHYDSEGITCYHKSLVRVFDAHVMLQA